MLSKAEVRQRLDGKPIQKGEKCEGYFAGIYCMKCWSPQLAAKRDEDYRD